VDAGGRSFGEYSRAGLAYSRFTRSLTRGEASGFERAEKILPASPVRVVYRLKLAAHPYLGVAHESHSTDSGFAADYSFFVSFTTLGARCVFVKKKFQSERMYFWKFYPYIRGVVKFRSGRWMYMRLLKYCIRFGMSVE
jgi:hypothetical protein